MKEAKTYSPNPEREIDFFEHRDRRKKLCPRDKGLLGTKPTLSNTEVLKEVAKSNQCNNNFNDLYIPFDFCKC